MGGGEENIAKISFFNLLNTHIMNHAQMAVLSLCVPFRFLPFASSASRSVFCVHFADTQIGRNETTGFVVATCNILLLGRGKDIETTLCW